MRHGIRGTSPVGHGSRVVRYVSEVEVRCDRGIWVAPEHLEGGWLVARPREQRRDGDPDVVRRQRPAVRTHARPLQDKDPDPWVVDRAPEPGRPVPGPCGKDAERSLRHGDEVGVLAARHGEPGNDEHGARLTHQPRSRPATHDRRHVTGVAPAVKMILTIDTVDAVPVVFALATFFSTLTGGLVALRNRDRQHLLLGFTAGVLLGVVAFDLIPELFRATGLDDDGVPPVMLAFAAGFVVLHLVERAAAMHRAHESEYGDHHHPAVGLLSASALVAHSFMDGFGIGLGFQASTEIGITVAIAVIAHDFADGLNTVTVMLLNRNSLRRSAVMLGLDALAPVLGAATTLLISPSEQALGLYLGFFAGFLLYLATADILPEAHARHPSRLTLVLTVAGMGVMFGVVSAA